MAARKKGMVESMHDLHVSLVKARKSSELALAHLRSLDPRLMAQARREGDLTESAGLARAALNELEAFCRPDGPVV